MRYTHRFEVDAPVERVAAFHRRPESLVAITPPLVPMRLLGAVPEALEPGDEIAFRMWLGPLPVSWRARIEALPDEAAEGGALGFADRQLAGPFGRWRHRHRFVPLAADRTAVEDEVEARLRRHPLWGVVGLKMWIGLPLLFAYRRAKTRQLLAGGRRSRGEP